MSDEPLPKSHLITQLTQSPEYKTLAAEAHARGITDVSFSKSPDRATIARLRRWAAETILPTDAFAHKSPYCEFFPLSLFKSEQKGKRFMK